MKLFRNYFFWAYERGSFHYDIMVTLILLFIFVSPRFIDFRDKPITTVPFHSSEVLVKQDGGTADAYRYIYEIRAEDLAETPSDSEGDMRAAIMRVIQPMAGNVTLESYAPVADNKGKIVAYDATVVR